MRKIGYMLLVTLLVMGISVTGLAKELVIGAGNWQPYYDPEHESGLDLELVKAAFALLPQYTFTFEYAGISRLLKDLDAGRLDAAVNILSKDTDVHLSEPFFRYTNVAVTLKKNNVVIESIADLQGKSLATFQNAKYIFGEEFTAMAKANPDYREYPQIDQMVNAVAVGAKDVYLADFYIFLYYLQENHPDMTPNDFDFHFIFPEVINPMGFKDPQVRDDFDQAAEQLRENGTYEATYDKYKTLLGFE